MRDKRAKKGQPRRLVVDFQDFFAKPFDRFPTNDQDTIAEEVQELLQRHGYDVEVTFIDVFNGSVR